MGRAVAVLGAVAVFAAGVGIGAGLGGDGDEPSPLPDDLELAGSLRSFDACDDLLVHVRERALEEVTPYGLRGGPHAPLPTDDVEQADEAARVDAAPETTEAGDAAAEGATLTPDAGTTPDDVSGTNVQEEGVDEPDVVKTDGEHVYSTIGGRLRVLDVAGDDPRDVASLDLARSGELLLAGDRLLVTSSGGPVVPFPGERLGGDAIAPGPGGTTTLTSIDVSDPTEPQVTERLTLDGATLSARMVDGVARIAIRTEAGAAIPWEHPEASGLRAEREALEANRELIRNSEVEDWLPYYVHEDADGGESDGVLYDCERVAQPSQYAGLGVLSVLTVDVGDGELVPDSAGLGVIAAGNTVYASTGRLYVATERWVDPEVLEDGARSGRRPSEVDRVTTQIHAFDISEPTTTEYLASGEVPGVLLDQWALSEHEGVLRVASTVGDRWWGGGEESSSLVTTLERDGDELVELEQVGDLGPTERIFAVRFLGEVGYVVTFRRIDPLYVVDLSDPARPQTTGELKIPGYSAYLHPLGDGLLLGVGQDAEEETGRPLGAQVSLFDVADPTDPQRLDTLTVERSVSDVEHDHRAFLHWPATGLSVVPLSRHWHGPEGDKAPEGPPNGALAFTADRDGFAAVGDGAPEAIALTHAAPVESGPVEGETSGREVRQSWQRQHDARIRRSMVIGDRLLTFSERAVVAHDLETLATVGVLEL